MNREQVKQNEWSSNKRHGRLRKAETRQNPQSVQIKASNDKPKSRLVKTSKNRIDQSQPILQAPKSKMSKEEACKQVQFNNTNIENLTARVNQLEEQHSEFFDEMRNLEQQKSQWELRGDQLIYQLKDEDFVGQNRKMNQYQLQHNKTFCKNLQKKINLLNLRLQTIERIREKSHKLIIILEERNSKLYQFFWIQRIIGRSSLKRKRRRNSSKRQSNVKSRN